MHVLCPIESYSVPSVPWGLQPYTALWRFFKPSKPYSTAFSSCRQKEERERERGASVISSDSSYKPSVGTWGIYERPKDISKAYGGGRNITPADSAITAEEQAEFDASLKEQLASFRRSAGLDVDPVMEAECQQLTEQGMRPPPRSPVACLQCRQRIASRAVT